MLLLDLFLLFIKKGNLFNKLSDNINDSGIITRSYECHIERRKIMV